MFKEFFKLWNAADLLTQSVNDSHEMLKIASEMFNIIDGNFTDINKDKLAQLKKEVRKKDYLLNHYDKSIRKKIYEHLVLRDKENQELYTSLVIFNIVGDVERIGDYIKNIYEVISVAELKDDHLNIFVNTMYNNIQELFKNTVMAYRDSEEEKAKEINDNFFVYKKEINEMLNKLIIKNDYNNPAGYALLLRYLKRIGAHLMHISTSISNPIDKIGYYVQ